MLRSPNNSIWQIPRRVCLFCALTALVGLLPQVASGQHKTNRPEPRYVSVGEPDPARGREIMTTFRQLGLPGDYFLEFNLEVLPRRGEKVIVPGRMWGSRNVIGPVSRMDLAATALGPHSQLITQNGKTSEAWRLREGIDESPQSLGDEEAMANLGGTGLRLFELQMPFIYWDDYIFEGATRIRGRTVHAFLMYPPESFSAAHPEVVAVRLHLDVNFHALMQAVILGEGEEPLRKLTVLDLKKLGDQWIVKSIEVRDEVTRDKVKFEVNGATLGLDFLPQLFAPEELGHEIASPRQVQRF